MSKRPGTVLGLLLWTTGVLAGLVAAGLAAIGGAGVAGLAAVAAGALTACVFFLVELDRVPVSSLVLVTLSLASIFALVRTSVAYVGERRVLARLPLRPLRDPALLAVARSADHRDLFVTPARRPAAFCFGLLRPRIVLTSGLLERLDAEERAAAVWHELHHARVREPLRSLVAQLAASTFFWIPSLRDVLARYALLKEIAADQLAMRRTSERALAGALSEVLVSPTIAGVGLSDLASARVERLFDDRAPLPSMFSRRRLAVSLVGVALLLLVAIFPARVDLGESAHLAPMLTRLSAHGLPGMAIGFLVNGVLLAALAFVVRGFARRP